MVLVGNVNLVYFLGIISLTALTVIFAVANEHVRPPSSVLSALTVGALIALLYWGGCGQDLLYDIAALP